MQIRLTIADQASMEDGGPTEFTAGNRGFEIGRHTHVDWTLADPVVSSVHCRISFENGAYFLTDVSKNGTYVNDSTTRVRSPYRLSDGDRLHVGPYNIDVAIAGDGGGQRRSAEPMPEPPQRSYGGDIWSLDQPLVEPVDQRLFVNEQRSRRGKQASDPLGDYVPLPPARGDHADESPFGQGSGDRLSQQLRGVRGSNIDEVPRAPVGQPSQYGEARGAGAAAPRPAPQPSAQQQDLFLLLCQAAGIQPETLQRRNTPELAGELGAVLKIVTEQTIALLRGRAEAKRVTKSADRTMVGPSQNNALKFAPTAQDAMSIMFGRSNAGYLDAPASFKQGFDDIKGHERATWAAMQSALLRLLEDFEPEKLEQKAGAGVLGSKKARAWEIYTEQWTAKSATENGMYDVFMEYFRAAYDDVDKS